VFTKIIERNTTIPTKKSQTFSTAQDSQTSVEVHVLQGEREMAKDNRSLGRFHLDGIAPAPRGLPQIEVTFDIDANGILNVAANDKATGKKQDIHITASSTLSKDDIEKLVKEAKEHETEDKQKRETVESKNKLESLVYEVEKNLKEHKEKISADDAKKVEEALAESKAALEAGDTTRIKKASEDLQQAAFKIGEAMYKAQADSAGAETAGQTAEQQASNDANKKDDNVVDAEFEETK
jgi:molecular chaperone DnaK